MIGSPLSGLCCSVAPVANAAVSDLARIATDCLRLELETFPKPGLVSHHDCGSHVDMDADAFARSIGAVQPYFALLASAGAQAAGIEELRAIGRDAEAAMLAVTGGVNTHRGAIFGLGLLCAAAGVRAAAGAPAQTTLGAIVARRWGNAIAAAPPAVGSHGDLAWRRYGVGGAKSEAARGFPSVYEIGLPALGRGALLAPDDDEAARVHGCFALIAAIDDTNLLHRGGPRGLRFAQVAARRFLAAGGVGRRGWRARAQTIHRAFIARRLSPGGSADLLAMSLFARALDRRFALVSRRR